MGAAIVVVMAVASIIAREFTENLGSSKRCVVVGLVCTTYCMMVICVCCFVVAGLLDRVIVLESDTMLL